MIKLPDDYGSLQAIFAKWWRDLYQIDASGNPRLANGTGAPLPRDRKAIAELRRIDVIDRGGHPAVNVERALCTDAFLKLIGKISGAGLKNPTISRWLRPEDFTLEPFAIAASTLARIRDNTSSGRDKCGATARLLGGVEPVFAEPRFKRLLRSRDDWPDLLAQARRIGAILEKKAPVGDLGASLVLWNADSSIPTRWAFNYYQGELEADASDTPQPPADAAAAPSV